jgi:hypothetical protein
LPCARLACLTDGRPLYRVLPAGVTGAIRAVTLMGSRFHRPDVVSPLRLSLRGFLQAESGPQRLVYHRLPLPGTAVQEKQEKRRSPTKTPSPEGMAVTNVAPPATVIGTETPSPQNSRRMSMLEDQIPSARYASSRLCLRPTIMSVCGSPWNSWSGPQGKP